MTISDGAETYMQHQMNAENVLSREEIENLNRQEYRGSHVHLKRRMQILSAFAWNYGCLHADTDNNKEVFAKSAFCNDCKFVMHTNGIFDVCQWRI